jgi:hypothetical protein
MTGMTTNTMEAVRVLIRAVLWAERTALGEVVDGIHTQGAVDQHFAMEVFLAVANSMLDSVPRGPPTNAAQRHRSAWPLTILRSNLIVSPLLPEAIASPASERRPSMSKIQYLDREDLPSFRAEQQASAGIPVGDAS